MNALELAITRAKQAGDQPSENGWAGTTRALGQSSLQVGDIFKIEPDVQPYDNTNLSTDTNRVQYCFVELYNADGSKKNEVRTLYPKSLCKNVLIYTKNEDGDVVSTGRLEHSEGQPCIDFAGESEISEAIKKVSGKLIRVKGMRNLDTASYPKRDKIVSTSVMTLEYV